MSEETTQFTPPDPDDIDDELQAREEFGSVLAANGYTDLLVLSREAGRAVLGGKRPALLDQLRDGEPESIGALARELDRDKAEVSRDLSRLAEHGVVEYVDGPRGAKAPRLQCEHVVIEPI